MAPPRPVTLRDFLELACDSSSDGFRSYPRRLARDADGDAPPQPQPPARPEASAADYHHILRRSPSRSPSSLFSSLSRTFSRRIKEGFWRRRFGGDEYEDDEEEAYFDDRDSCGFPSPMVSTCCSASSSDSESDHDGPEAAEDSNRRPASECDGKASSSFSLSFSSSSSADHEDDCTDDAAPATDGNKAAVAEGDSMAMGRKLGAMEDKQQLSPVSVLDFPFDDDEGSDAGTCSPAFQIRTKQQQAQHKSRRYDPAVDVDLDARFLTAASESGEESVGASTRLAATSSSSTTYSSGGGATSTTAPRHVDEEEHPSPPCQEPDDDDECRLLPRLLQEEGFAEFLVDDEAARALVLDFFAEGVGGRLRSVSRRRRVAEEEEEALVRAAAEWLRGAGPRWGVADVALSGNAALADMERGRRWMCVVGQEEERDVGEAVEGMVADALVDELVAELLVPCC